MQHGEPAHPSQPRIPSDFLLKGHPWSWLLQAWTQVEAVVRDVPLTERPRRLAVLTDEVLILDPLERVTFAHVRDGLDDIAAFDPAHCHNQHLSLCFDGALVQTWRQAIECAIALHQTVPQHYAFYSSRHAAYIVRTLLVIPSPEAATHVALLGWHRGLRHFGTPPPPPPPT